MARAQAALRARPGTRNRALPTGCLLALACLADATALEDDSAASSASLLSRLLLAAAYLGLLMGALRLLRDLVDKHLRAWARRTDTQVDDAIVAVLQHESEGGLVFAYGVIAAWLAARSAGLDLVDTPIANAEPFVRLLVLLLASWRASTIAYGIIAAALGGSAVDSRKNAEHGRAVELVLKGTQLALLCIAGLFVCDNLGVSVNSVLGAMGVLSITGSLSSQAVLTDAISYFAVSLDKPFEVGDYVKVSGSKMARVLSVGWKTTRLRALDGELLVFTNSDIAKSRLSNYKGMDRRRTKFNLHLGRETPVAFLKAMPEYVKEAVQCEPKGEFLNCTLLGDGFNASAGIAVEIIYYGHDCALVEFKELQHRVNVRILESMEKNNVRVIEGPRLQH